MSGEIVVKRLRNGGHFPYVVRRGNDPVALVVTENDAHLLAAAIRLQDEGKRRQS